MSISKQIAEAQCVLVYLFDRRDVRKTTFLKHVHALLSHVQVQRVKFLTLLELGEASNHVLDIIQAAWVF